MDVVRALRGQHEPKRLEWDPTKLVGLSEEHDAFMQNVDWEEVNRRAEEALRLSGAAA